MFSYQQWLRLLETENRKLKLKLKVLQPEDKDYLNHESYEILRKKKMTKQDQRFSMACQYRQYRKRKKLDLGMIVAWGLAVTLGLSLVSAGFLLGWNMGWILPNL